jgi:hypothetical protein
MEKRVLVFIEKKPSEIKTAFFMGVVFSGQALA